MVWIFCPEMTLAQFPKSKFWNFCWIFCPEMTLAQFPEFGFFVQNSRIGVNNKINRLNSFTIIIKIKFASMKCLQMRAYEKIPAAECRSDFELQILMAACTGC